MSVTTDLGVYECSFCAKSKTEVKKLIAGPGVYICDSCVQLCNNILTEDEKLEPGALPNDAPPEVVLGWLRGVARSVRTVERDLALKVAFLRDHGRDWAEIAAALDLTESEARDRFSTS